MNRCANLSLYLKYKEKYNWVEPEPSYFDMVGLIENRGWYKSWGTGSPYEPYHREDGPARMWEDGLVEYWYNGIFYKDVTNLDDFYIKRILE